MENALLDLELKDDATSVCLRPYPVPMVHETMFRKEVERLVKIGVPEESNESEWAAPSFAQPKGKTNRVRFLSDFRNLNRQLKPGEKNIAEDAQSRLPNNGIQETTHEPTYAT